MLRMSKTLIAIATLVSGIAFAEPETYSLRFSNMPPLAGMECDDFAFNEGARLTKLIGNSIENFAITDTRCSPAEIGDNLDRWMVEISYQGKTKLEVVTTFDTITSERPGYESEAECKSALETEKSLFAAQTKLPVFAAYCRVPTFKKHPWEINVTGFGSAMIRPFSTHTSVNGTILGHNRESFTSMLKNTFKKYGNELAQVSIFGRLAYSTLAIRFYGNERIQLEETPLAVFNQQDFCMSEVSQTQSALNDAKTINFGVYCQKTAITPPLFELVTLTNARQGLTLAKPTTTYPNIEECLAAKPTVINHYVQNLKRDIKSGLCSYNRQDKKFTVVMIEKKRS
jgi:hypothetical protein